MEDSKFWPIVQEFANVNKSEGAFYLKFQALSADQKEILSEYYDSVSEMDMFEQICKFWNVS